MSDTPEFSHPFDIRGITAEPVTLTADATQRAALANRFDLIAVKHLEAKLSLEAGGTTVSAKGKMTGAIVQSCAVSGEDLPVTIKEDIELRFVPAGSLEVEQPDEEVELDAEELDDIGYHGTSFDLGEAVAQSLALAIDPFATGPDADTVRREQGLVEEDKSGPLAEALRGLQGD